MASIEQQFAPTVERFSGFARDYDSHRPSPPAALGVMDLLKAGYPESDLGIPELEGLARLELGEQDRAFYWTARVRVGVV
jgi:hypothetical protein